MDKTFTDSQVIRVLRKMVENSTYRKVAADLGMDGAFIFHVLKGTKGLSDNLGLSLGFKPILTPPRKWTHKR